MGRGQSIRRHAITRATAAKQISITIHLFAVPAPLRRIMFQRLPGQPTFTPDRRNGPRKCPFAPMLPGKTVPVFASEQTRCTVIPQIHSLLRRFPITVTRSGEQKARRACKKVGILSRPLALNVGRSRHIDLAQGGGEGNRLECLLKGSYTPLKRQ